MKNNWQIKKLSDICNVFTDGNWIESKDQSPKGIRLIQTGNIGQGYFKNHHERARYISDKTFKRLHCTEIFEGDVLTSRLPDPVGRSCIIPNIGERMITAVDCSIIRFDLTKILPTYFNYYAQSNAYLNDIEQLTSGTTRKRISRKNLGLIKIPIPSVPEQQRIVKILNDVFEKTTKAKENTKKNLENSKEIFDSYLKNIFENPKKDWKEIKLKEICDKLFAGGDIPKNNFSKIRTEKYNTPIFANGFKDKGLYGYTNLKKVTEPSITISARGTIGYAEIRKEAFYPIVRLIVITPNVKIIDLSFLYYMTHNFKFSNTGTSIPQLTIPMIESINIPTPSLQEQKTIVKKLNTLSTETKKLESIYKQKLEDLEELKKSILKRAFNGDL
jgi:type I restriction enzyme, S subunit